MRRCVAGGTSAFTIYFVDPTLQPTGLPLGKLTFLSAVSDGSVQLSSRWTLVVRPRSIVTWHLNPEVILCLSLHEGPAGRQSHSTGSLLVFPNRVVYAFHQLPVKIIDAIIGVLIPDRKKSVAALILILTLFSQTGEDLQCAFRRHALAASGIWPDRRKSDRR